MSLFRVCTLSCRKAEDESRIEELEVARSELEEKLHLSDARRMELEARVAALTKQNAGLARSGNAGGGSGGGTREGLDTVKAQLKGYTKGVEVSAGRHVTSRTCGAHHALGTGHMSIWDAFK